MNRSLPSAAAALTLLMFTSSALAEDPVQTEEVLQDDAPPNTAKVALGAIGGAVLTTGVTAYVTMIATVNGTCFDDDNCDPQSEARGTSASAPRVTARAGW